MNRKLYTIIIRMITLSSMLTKNKSTKKIKEKKREEKEKEQKKNISNS